VQPYSESIKEQMVRRLLIPRGDGVRELSAETGISKSALFQWKREAKVKTKRPGEKEWTASEKLRVLGGGAAPLEGEAFGALLRREGLHEAQVTAWRVAAAEALGAEAAPGGVANSAQREELAEAKKRVKELEREALRKDKALAEAAALLLLEKKLQSIGWHSAVGSTDEKSDE
jgi:transposase-like protein